MVASARAADPLLDYRAFYRARVLAQSTDRLRLDVEPDDKRLPLMSEIPIKHGVPGAVITISAGAFVMVGWENADPSRPHAAVFDHGAGVVKLVLNGTEIVTGGESGAEKTIKGETYRMSEAQLTSALSTFVAALVTYAGAIKSIADPSNAATAALTTAATAMTTAITTFEGQASSYLTTNTKVK